MINDVFAEYHPLVSLIYFALVLFCSVTLTHPVCLAVSLVCALAYSGYLNRRGTLRFNLLFMLPLLIVTALINPAFNHEGVTVLAYLPSGNPLTLESVLYGAAAAVMLITSVNWFSCMNRVFTGDKFIVLFGRAVPAVSLILSMTLRLVPRFKAQLTVIRNAQRGVGRDISGGGVIKRARMGVRILSVLVSWALENAVETADSMKGRGYGLPGRTAFSVYRFDRRDVCAGAFFAACGGVLIAGAVSGGLAFRYFPALKGGGGFVTIILSVVYCALCVSPVVMNVWEGAHWKATQSKI